MAYHPVVFFSFFFSSNVSPESNRSIIKMFDFRSFSHTALAVGVELLRNSVRTFCTLYEMARNCRFSRNITTVINPKAARLAAFNYHVNHNVTEKYITGG